jgi:HEAT repeat protein
MNLFGLPNIRKMAEENDYTGLHRALEHRNPLVRLGAAHALAEMNDGTGWRVLTDAVGDSSSPESQEIAAALLSELGSASEIFARRAAPIIGDALKRTRGDTAAALREALEAMDSPEAETALRQAGYEPAPTAEVEEVTDFEAHFVRPVLPQVEGFQLLSAEQHLNNAVQLREAEIGERGLVETSLALWLKPNWAYAWYLRGVLFEDLERPYEAMLAYERALSIDTTLRDASDALEDLREDETFPPLEADLLARDLTARGWRARRDSAAGLCEIARTNPAAARPYLENLLELLEDGEREVRRAAIEALGNIGSEQAEEALVAQRESSWLLRFSLIEALSTMRSVDGLVEVLRRDMNRIQERNPVFSSQRDPLVEVEYGALMEIGVRALERTGDLERLLEIAEANVWVETEEDEEEYSDQPQDMLSDEYYDELEEGYIDEDEEGDEQDEDLMSYVDEAAQMVTTALERLALVALSGDNPTPLPRPLIQRLAQVPDLTLIDLAADDDSEAQTSVVHDLSAVRKAAEEALLRQ